MNAIPRSPAVVLASLLFAGAAVAGVPDLYDFDVPASFIDRLGVDTSGGGEDLNGDGVPDNAMGTIFGALRPLVGDLNESIQASIDDGSLLLGAAWPTLERGLPDSGDVVTHILGLVDPDDNPTTRDAFLVDRASFEPGSAMPLFAVSDGTLAARKWTAGPTDFPLVLPLGDLLLDLVIQRATFRGTLSEKDGGIAVAEGTVSGVVTLRNLFDAFNAYLITGCRCLNLDGPLLIFDSLDSTWSCTGDVDNQCPAGDTCGTVAGFCPLLLAVFQNNADVDTDGDGAPDALSVFLTYTMAPTDLLGPGGPADCNDNGVPDVTDIADGTSSDADGNGVPDECVPPVLEVFHRGDANGDGGLNIADGSFVLNFLFLGGPEPPCGDAADANGDGGLNIADGSFILNFLFLGGPPPPDPGPPADACGPNPDGPALGCAVTNC